MKLGSRQQLNSKEPYAFFVEPERSRRGEIEQVATLFLTNRECPFQCVMCDLWKNTLLTSVLRGEIPSQIRYALTRLPQATSIKLYNSGNFFDPRAIPVEDYPAIADLVRSFRTVIVENHPKLCNVKCQEFAAMVRPAELEVAIGLETCHEETLRWLGKGMTLQDFEYAVRELQHWGIYVRVFLLLGLPGMNRRESVDWTLRSIEYAARLGVDCFSVIPTRADMPALNLEKEKGRFAEPNGWMLEQIMERASSLNAGRVFVDLWDAQRFFQGEEDVQARIAKLQAWNLQS